MNQMPRIAEETNPLGQVAAALFHSAASSPTLRRMVARGEAPPIFPADFPARPFSALTRTERFAVANFSARYLDGEVFDFDFEDADPQDPRSITFRPDPRMPRRAILAMVEDLLAEREIGTTGPEPAAKIAGLGMKPGTALARLEAFAQAEFIDENDLSIHELNAAGILCKTSSQLRREAREGAAIVGFFEAELQRQFHAASNCRRERASAVI